MQSGPHTVTTIAVSYTQRQGGFGITYLGIDELHEKKVAIKEFFPQGIVTRNIEYQDTVTVSYTHLNVSQERIRQMR